MQSISEAKKALLKFSHFQVISSWYQSLSVDKQKRVSDPEPTACSDSGGVDG
jgi:hypothetical protein